jgi:hypothetical protein
MKNHGGMILTGGKPKNSEKNLPTSTLSTTNPTWHDMVANPGLRDESPATNRLSHGTAETTANFYENTRRNIPVDSHLYTRPYDNQKSHLEPF